MCIFARPLFLRLQATTATLTAIILMQVVNVFLCRSDTQTAFSSRVFTNKLLLLGVATESGADDPD